MVLCWSRAGWLLWPAAVWPGRPTRSGAAYSGAVRSDPGMAARLYTQTRIEPSSNIPGIEMDFLETRDDLRTIASSSVDRTHHGDLAVSKAVLRMISGTGLVLGDFYLLKIQKQQVLKRYFVHSVKFCPRLEWWINFKLV